MNGSFWGVKKTIPILWKSRNCQVTWPTGPTCAEAVKGAQDIREWIETARKKGRPIPEPPRKIDACLILIEI